jgi:signal transduction histidine kinase
MTGAGATQQPMTLERLVRPLDAPRRSQRALRYRGDDRAVPLSALVETDRAAVKALYALLTDLGSQLNAIHATSGPTDESHAAQGVAKAFDLDRAFQVAHAIGVGGEPYLEEVRHTLHDVRGGALTSLLLEIQRTRVRPGERSLRALRTLTADHLKVMRNALLELDDVKRTADLAPVEHSIERLAETIERVSGEGSRGSVRVDEHRSFLGGITMSCVELGALDRAVLNLLNNAVRHSASDEVKVALVPASSEPGSDLRVFVANAVEEGHAAALHARFGDDLSRIFVESYSTTGSGDGLKICLEFVASAYGLVRGDDAVEERLVGAVLEDGWFIAWLHWPAVA